MLKRSNVVVISITQVMTLCIEARSALREFRSLIEILECTLPSALTIYSFLLSKAGRKTMKYVLGCLVRYCNHCMGTSIWLPLF
jgi:hypothetical protein